MIHELLSLAGNDEEDLDKVSEMLANLKQSEPLPDPEAIRTQLRSGLSLNDKGTVAEWMDIWLAQERGKHAASTEAGYESHARLYIKPKIGHLRRTRLNLGDLIEMFNEIEDDNDKIEADNADRRANIDRAKEIWGHRGRGPIKAELRRLKAERDAMPPFRRPVGPSSQKSILRTLRAALNDAISQQRLTYNPAAHFELNAVATRPIIWTEERVERWRVTGQRPGPVMVWTPAQVGIFLDYVAEHDPDYEAMWHLLFKFGPRRGEVAGLPMHELQLAVAKVHISTQRTERNGYEEKAPKSEAGIRTLLLDPETVTLLAQHVGRQLQRKTALGEQWIDSGKVFTRDDGAPLRPSSINDWLAKHIQAAELPPIRLHDARHTAATLQLAAGTDRKVVQAMLGHSKESTTSDTYTSVLKELLAAAAESVTDLIPRRHLVRPPGHVSATFEPSYTKLKEGTG